MGILPGQVEAFTDAAKAMVPILRAQPGFRACLLLRSGPAELEATVMSIWESMEALRDSETAIFQEALVNFLSHCERHPQMREEEVLLSEFPAGDPDDTVTDL
jgi:heme-degrading monooxygenase HmoA